VNHLLKIVEIYIAISIPATLVVCAFFCACEGREEEEEMVKPYESYTLMKETELGWRDGR
jgi:hypothetical protein